MRSRIATLARAALVAVSLAALPAVGATPPAGRQAAAPAVEHLPGDGVPVEKTHTYRLAGRIRPLLFWFGKDDVGTGRIVWRRSGGGTRAYELLVGSDPAKTPRGLNRWGYVAEEVTGANGVLLALMTRADESSLDEAEASAAQAGSGMDFRAMHASLEQGTITARVWRVETPGVLSVFDVDATLDRVRRGAASATPRQARARPGALPGFLVAVAHLVDLAVAARSGQQRAAALTSVVPYSFGRNAYDLRLRDIEQVPPAGGERPTLVRLPFEIRTIATDARTRFELTCGTAGDLAGVPVRIQWQPRWWLRLELHLDDRGARRVAPDSR
jgi:hypothetical protein